MVNAREDNVAYYILHALVILFGGLIVATVGKGVRVIKEDISEEKMFTSQDLWA